MGKLTAVAVKAALANPGTYQDGDGLFLKVGKTGAASWLLRLQRDGKRQDIGLGSAKLVTLAEARAIMVEGESGLLAVSPPYRRPVFEPSLRRLSWPNGALAYLYSAAEPESLRGPQHSHAWCDEIAKWDNAGARATQAWDNLMMGLRLGEDPRVVATTTPRPVPLMMRLLAGEASGDTVVSRGTSYDNAENLPARFLSEMRRSFGQTALGRQELEVAMLSEAEGSLWNRAAIEMSREAPGALLERIVIGVDPPAGANGDACRIVVVGVGTDGIARVLDDRSVTKPSPEQWARAVAAAHQKWSADRIVAEANQGGAMVESVLRAADVALPVKLVHASRGKVARAEPVAALYEVGRVRHAGTFPRLEDEMCGLCAGGTYQGPGRSPDRADALVWALSELMLGGKGRPRIWMQ